MTKRIMVQLFSASGALVVWIGASYVIRAPEDEPPFLPNEPAAYNQLGHLDFSSEDFPEWIHTSESTVDVSASLEDQGAPVSPPGVIRTTFAAGEGSGAGADFLLSKQLAGEYTSLYLSFALRLPGWEGPYEGIDNALLLEGSSGSVLTVYLMDMLGDAVSPSLVLEGLPGLGEWNIWELDPNVGAAVTVGDDEWHHWEVVFTANASGAADGEVRWWIDGQQVGKHVDLELWAGPKATVTEVTWTSFTWNALQSKQSLWLDDLYVSGWIGDHDQIVVTNNTIHTSSTISDELKESLPPDFQLTPANETVVLIDATFPGDGSTQWVNDTAISSQFQFANLMQHDAGHTDEIVVFSVDDRVVLDQGDAAAGTIWTDAAGQTRKVDLAGGRLKVPIVIWLISSHDEKGGPSEATARLHVEAANLFYNLNRVGIEFVAEVVDISDGSWAGSVNGQYSCVIPPDDAFVPGQLNVYYVPSLPNWLTGAYCNWFDDGIDPNVIYISINSSQLPTLAHELGHAFGLQHTGAYGVAKYKEDGNWLIGWDNLMWAGGVAKSTLTLGQAFRINLDKVSMLNRNGTRVGPVRECECETAAEGCSVGSDDAVQPEGMTLCPKVWKPWW